MNSSRLCIGVFCSTEGSIWEYFVVLIGVERFLQGIASDLNAKYVLGKTRHSTENKIPMNMKVLDSALHITG